MLKQLVLSGILIAALFSAGNIAARERPEWRDWATGERYVLGAAYYKPQLDTTVAIGGENGGLGAVISFEKNLKLDSRKGTGLLYGRWRPFKRHVFRVDYFDLERSSFGKASGASLLIGDKVLDVTLPVSSFFDIKSVNFAYSFSVIMNPKHDLSLGLGLSVQQLNFGIVGNSVALPGNGGQLPLDQFIDERAELLAPVPTFNVGYRYAIADDWMFDVNAGWFAIDLELNPNEDFGGNVFSGDTGVRWKAFKNAGLRLGYQIFDVDIDYRKRRARGVLDYRYKGPTIAFESRF